MSDLLMTFILEFIIFCEGGGSGGGVFIFIFNVVMVPCRFLLSFHF